MLTHTPPDRSDFLLGTWLLFCAGVVFLMVIVGGITRLTQSGLSMVEWAPLMGVLPPLSLADWQDVFAKYQTSPEYLEVNFGMSLAEFKKIFWWEYGHRVLGRVIGLLYLFPLLYFWAKGMVPSAWRLRLFGLFLLGGLQGLMGWYMVQSGLADVPRVSQYRLTAHLGLALIIFGFMWWFALCFLRGEKSNNEAAASFRRLTILAAATVFIMMLSGGFVAGTKAGYIINTFPKMNGEWVPAGWLAMQPIWRNFFENAITIQYVHRLLAVLVSAVLLIMCFSALKERYQTGWQWPLILLVLQVVLGISALLLIVPVALGAAHQAGAVGLFASTLYVAHRARFSPQRSS